ncbi:MAG: 2-C-methyl-D-erythritol 4-phosphate cytidylyltransferase [Eubacteriales bacterium]|nr:2-C-methyl-D-erythritol 4-phosphate cytidylyltransferase [Eubacteriales bacterium]
MKKTNVYGVVLAGGVGTRMGNVEKPKQFMEVGKKPIIVHTIEKFVVHPGFERIIVLSPKAWIKYTQDVIRKYIPNASDIDVIEGGATRNETIMNSIRHIEEQYGLDEDTIIVTHDSVRPFVTHRILEDNIRYAREAGACDTVIPATDTIVESTNHCNITNIPDRAKMYQGQTPQSFRAKKLRSVYEALTDEEKQILTDACKILVLKGEQVRLVDGEVFNIKITYPYDLRVAESLLGGDILC